MISLTEISVTITVLLTDLEKYNFLHYEAKGKCYENEIYWLGKRCVFCDSL